jgi:SAM-dependent methyltransferase
MDRYYCSSDARGTRKLVVNVDDDYRISHQSENYGTVYNRTYEKGYFAALWRKVEQPLLEAILRRLGGLDRRCLDFATGTGRIANAAAAFFGEIVAVDVSESMLACATVPENVCLRCLDITKQDLGEVFDVVTAFRFFLNAEGTLRRDALAAIHRHLRNEGRLVCNIHMNSSSPAGLAYRLLNRAVGRTIQNTINLREFAGLLLGAGFVIEETVAYGFLVRPGPFAPGLCESLIEPVERVSKTLKIPGRFAQNFIVVARKQ